MGVPHSPHQSSSLHLPSDSTWPCHSRAYSGLNYMDCKGDGSSSSTTRFIGHYSAAFHDHMQSTFSSNAENNGHDLAQDKENTVSHCSTTFQPMSLCRPIDTNQGIDGIDLSAKDGAQKHVTPSEAVTFSTSAFNTITCRKRAAKDFLQLTWPKANQSMHLAFHLNTRHVVAKHPSSQNQDGSVMIFHGDESNMSHTSSSLPVNSSTQLPHPSTKAICLITEQTKARQIRKHKVLKDNKYTTKTKVKTFQSDTPNKENSTNDTADMDCDRSEGNLGAFTNTPDFTFPTNHMVIDSKELCSPASYEKLTSSTIPATTNTPSRPTELVELHEPRGLEDPQIVLSKNSISAPHCSNNAVTSSNHVTLNNLDVDGNDKEGLQEFQLKVQIWSDILHATCQKAVQLLQLFGDKPSPEPRLLDVLKNVDRAKNWITAQQARDTRIARAVKLVKITYKATEEEEYAVRILNNFAQRFTRNSRRFMVTSRRDTSSEREMQAFGFHIGGHFTTFVTRRDRLSFYFANCTEGHVVVSDHVGKYE
ncbi:hypothetical protein F5I97DRAFT_1864865 [Phlebopus sp. FC_14]|nr:hypothetical protein F5I97DRAFT_1864865 [Phlebopus sp. FC_14]